MPSLKSDPAESSRCENAFLEALQWLEALPKRQQPLSMLEALRTFFPVNKVALYYQRGDGVSWRLETSTREPNTSAAPFPGELTPKLEPGKCLMPDVLTGNATSALLTDPPLQLVLDEPGGSTGGAVCFDLLEARKALAIFSWTAPPTQPAAMIERIRIFLWMAGCRMATDRERRGLQSEKRFLEVVMNHSSDFIYSKNASGTFTRCNLAFAKFLGLDHPEQVVGKKDSDFFKDAASQETADMTPGVRHACFERRDGTAVWVSMTEAAEYDEGDAHTGTVGIAQDITQRRLSEGALEQRRALLEVTLRSVVEAVITFNEEGRVLLMNPVAEQLIGLTTAKVYGRHVDEWLNVAYDQEGHDRVHPLREVLQDEEKMETLRPVFLRDAAGQNHTVLLRAAPIHAREQGLFGAVLAMLDVTRQQEMEREARKAEKLESLGLLAGGIAHDFNNLLTALLGNITLAAMETSSHPRVQETLGSAQRACQRAQALSGQLLTFAKGGAPNKQLAPLADILRESVQMALQGSNMAINFEFPAQIPEVEIDECQMRQAFENLALNARQAMQSHGGLTIRIRTDEPPETAYGLEPAPAYLAIDFVDGGDGIADAEQEKIFDPYYTTKRRGTGLGLSICRSVVQRHGGSIVLESALGRGSCFTVWLPALTTFYSTSTPSTEMPQSTDNITSTGTSPSGAPCRLLLFDDEEAILDFAKRCCAMMGHEVKTAADSDSAIKLVKEAKEAGQPFHLAILDLSVPGDLAGDELLPMLREIEPSLKAIVSSGYSDDPVVTDYAEKGFDGCLIKPYRVTQLREIINQALEHS